MKLCKCLYCEKEFKVYKRASKYCTPVCRASDYVKKNKDKVLNYKIKYYKQNKEEINGHNMANYYANKQILENRSCKRCNIEFSPTRIDNKFCSQKCGSSYWCDQNKEYIKIWSKNKYHTDINHKLKLCLRSRLNKALRGNIKSKGTMQLIGCTIEELKVHLESQFEPWMTWDNYGAYDKNRKTWQIDHVRPLNSFDLSSDNQQKEACNYNNLQPLLAKNNLIKGAKHV